MKIILVVFIIISINSCKNNKPINLSNPSFLKISDSLIVKLDSVTFGGSKNMQLIDSLLMIQNEINNTITFINLNRSKTYNYNFDQFKVSHPKFKVDASWFTSIDSIFIYSSFQKIIYLFNKQTYCFDSFPIKSDTPEVKLTITPMPSISTCQQPTIYKNSIYAPGFSLGENSKSFDTRRYVLNKITKDKTFFFVNYPIDYKKSNWGGIYYRMVYNCLVEDSLIYISFPASDYIAIFNMNTNRTKYIKLYPEINKLIRPFSGSTIISAKDNIKRAEHFYGQYSFKGIIYDKYRKIFYRYLLLPTSEKDFNRGSLGIKKKYLLAYDSKLNFLGYTELSESISSTVFFITERGFLVKDEKYYYDEDNLHFKLYTINHFK